MEKNTQSAAVNVDTLRTLHNNQVELAHRVTGKRMSFNAKDYADGKLEDSGYNPNDWIPADEYEGPEEHPNAGDPSNQIHPAFVGTDQRIGNFLGQTPEERAQHHGIPHPEHGLGINGGAMAHPETGNAMKVSDPNADAQRNAEAAVAKVAALNPNAVVEGKDGKPVVDLNVAKADQAKPAKQPAAAKKEDAKKTAEK